MNERKASSNLVSESEDFIIFNSSNSSPIFIHSTEKYKLNKEISLKRKGESRIPRNSHLSKPLSLIVLSQENDIKNEINPVTSNDIHSKDKSALCNYNSIEVNQIRLPIIEKSKESSSHLEIEKSRDDNILNQKRVNNNSSLPNVMNKRIMLFGSKEKESNHLKTLSKSYNDSLSFSSNSVPSLNLLNKFKNKEIIYNISSSGLSEIPKEIAYLENIYCINASFNYLQELPLKISTMSDIRTLLLSNNQFKDLPKQITHLPNLHTLNLSYNKISQVSHDIGIIKSLKTLDLQNNKIKNVSNTIENLMMLTYLNLSYNKIKCIPETLGNCFNLKELYLEGNMIDYIPYKLTDLTNLERLNVSKNRIHKLLPIGGFSKLRILYVSNNQLKTFTEGTFNLIELEELNISSNEIELLPEELGNLRNLKIFDSSFNKIKVIPSSIRKCKKLKSINLNNNLIYEFNINICRLSNLQLLDLSNNLLKEIPSDIIKLPSNTVINLSSNNLWTLPYQLLNAKSIENRLDISKNPLDFFPEGSRNLQSILKYMKRMHMKASWKWMKLVIVGEEYVGKTSLRNQLSGYSSKKKKPKSISTIATDGIDIEDIEVNISDGDESSIIFRCWDFAGQQIYHPTHQFFLTKKSIYLIVLNLLDVRLSKIEYWLKILKNKLESDIAVIIVGTHLDDKRCDKKFCDDVFNKMKKRFDCRFPFIKEYIPVSSKTGKGINKLIRNLVTTSQRLKRYEENVPISYLLLEGRIKLQKQKNFIITLSKFKKLAKESGVRDKQINHCLQFLHNAGIVLYYDNINEDLKDVVIIDPQWIVDLMSSLITLKHTYAKGGILLKSNLPHIWKTYPPEQHSSLLQLLQKFEILFNITNKQLASIYYNSHQLNYLHAKAKYRKKENEKMEDMIINNGKVKSQNIMNLSRSKKKDTSHSYNNKLYSTNEKKICKGSDDSFVLSSKTEHPISTRANRKGSIDDSILTNSQSYNSNIIRNKDEEIIIIPSLLPNEPSTERLHELWNDTSQFLWNIFGRRYQFSFLPVGFFSRLIIRLLHIHGISVIYIWHSGIVVDSLGKRALIEYFESDYRLELCLKEKRASNIDDKSIDLLRLLCDSIETLLLSWFKISPHISIPCYKCLLEKYFIYPNKNSLDIYYFDIQECMIAVRDSVETIECMRITENGNNKTRLNNHTCRLKDLCPDVSFGDFLDITINFNDIKLKREIGKGSYAILYEGSYKSNAVAVKVLKDSENLSLITQIFRELQHETFIMKNLKNPYIVEMKGICINPLAIIMDFHPLGSLDNYLYNRKENPKFSWKYRYKIAYNIARGLEYLHQEDFIHRDLRSPNILLSSLDENSDIVAKISDFGMTVLYAKGMAGGDFHECWTAPEILKNESYDCKIDVYSFGIVLWELLQTGFPFFEYNDQYAGKPRIDFFEAIINGLRPTIPDDCPKEYEQLIRQCWLDDPKERPSIGKVADQLIDMIDKL